MRMAIFICLIAILLLPNPIFAANSAPDGIGAFLPKDKIVNMDQRKKYSGNIKTNKFHWTGCKFFDCRDCTKYFPSYSAAINAGFKPCGKCNPSEAYD